MLIVVNKMANLLRITDEIEPLVILANFYLLIRS